MTEQELKDLEAKIEANNLRRNRAKYAGNKAADTWQKSKPYSWVLAKEVYPDSDEEQRAFVEGFNGVFAETAESAAKAFDDYLNHGGNKQRLAEAWSQQHRTIIQLEMGVILRFIKIMAENYDKGWYDARNEDTCKAAKKIMDALGEDFWWNGSPSLRYV